MSWRRRAVVGVTAGLLAGATTVMVASQAHADGLSTDAYGAAMTDSAVTVTENSGPFAGMKFTVNQTQGLTNQALSVSWSHGTPTTILQNSYAANYVQIMQCWGDPVSDDSTPVSRANFVPTNDYSLTTADGTTAANNYGPAREHCEYGANPTKPSLTPTLDHSYGATRTTNRDNESYGLTSTEQPAYTATTSALVDIPFVAQTGAVVKQTDTMVYGATADNSFFDWTSTNEVDGSRTFADGTGHSWFQADTGFEAPGLGCGQTLPKSSTLTPCWLVIVPRGNTALDGTVLDGQNGNPSVNLGSYVSGSPLDRQAWVNRISIPLNFQPLASTCPGGADEVQATGSQLVTAAMTSWQPTLCNSTPATFGYNSLDDDQSRAQLAGGISPLVFTSNPVSKTQLQPGTSVLYAPASISGLTIGFNVDQKQPDDVAGKQQLSMKLTPRLVAKLLTFSYRGNFVGAVDSAQVHPPAGTQTAPGYRWLLKNPYSITDDKDFQQYNGDQLSSYTIDAASMMLELGNMDVAAELWQWVLADPAAVAWLKGTPDPWGMVVDPYYSMTAKTNPSKTAFSPTSSFPQNDPWKTVTSGSIAGDNNVYTSPPITMLDYHPYVQDLVTAARQTLSANDGQHTSWTPGVAAGSGFSAGGPQAIGSRFIMSFTDTPSAIQYGVATASLSAAGDDGAHPTFVAPTTGSMLAAVKVMKPSAVDKSVLTPNPTADAGAYPLTTLTYAAVVPQNLSRSECRDYGDLLSYISGPGQQSGTDVGQLPLGYVPLPSKLSLQAVQAASKVLSCPRPASSGATSTGSGSSSSSSTTQVASSGTGKGNSAGDTANQTADVAPPAEVPLSPAGNVPSVPAAVVAPGSTAVVPAGLVLAAGTTPDDPTSFSAALPVGVIVGLIAAVIAPLLSGAGRRSLLMARAAFAGGLRRPRDR